jgi:hypothetical protein
MRRLLSVGLGLTLLASSALAQLGDRSSDTARPTRPVTIMPPRVPVARPVRASAILGAQVAIRAGDTLGKVADLVIGGDGRVDYVIVQNGSDYTAVPWGAIRYTTGDRVLLLTEALTRDRLRAVTFRASAWPDFLSDRWLRSAREVCGDRYLSPAPPNPRPGVPPPVRTGPRAPERSSPDLPGGTGNPEDRRPPA